MLDFWTPRIWNITNKSFSSWDIYLRLKIPEDKRILVWNLLGIAYNPRLRQKRIIKKIKKVNLKRLSENLINKKEETSYKRSWIIGTLYLKGETRKCILSHDNHLSLFREKIARHSNYDILTLFPSHQKKLPKEMKKIVEDKLRDAINILDNSDKNEHPRQNTHNTEKYG